MKGKLYMRLRVRNISSLIEMALLSMIAFYFALMPLEKA